MSFRKTALSVVGLMLASVVIAFIMDYLVIFTVFEDVRTQTYVGGFYVAGMAADPTALASGSTDSNLLYNDADIHESFTEFSKASFGGMSIEEPQERSLGNTKHMQFKVNKMLIRNIITSCNILSSGGSKGVEVTVEYQIEPRINMLFGEDSMLDFPYYRLRITRRFRLMGQ